jgi:hypothetical protein
MHRNHITHLIYPSLVYVSSSQLCAAHPCSVSDPNSIEYKYPLRSHLLLNVPYALPASYLANGVAYLLLNLRNPEKVRCWTGQ